MSEIADQDLSGVAETLLLPLYNRAMESQRPDAMLKDDKAVALVTQMGSDAAIRYAIDQVRQIPMNELLKVMRIMFTREFDRFARDFISRHPEAVVVHIGCGLDSRFERVVARNSQVQWYDLDLPGVIDLGILPLENVPLLLNALDVAVICNRENDFGRYCFPQKACEVMACSVPIIAARVGSMKERLADYPEWLFTPDDPGALARTLEHRLNDRRTAYPPVLSWADLANGLEKIMASLVQVRDTSNQNRSRFSTRL